MPDERPVTYAPLAFHVMLKPSGALCNLHCAYCFYLDKEALYPGASFRMSPEVLESFTRQYIAAQQAPQAVFAWQGGEPTLMGLEFFRQAVALQDTYRRPGMRIENALQTNATLLDDAWCDFLHQRRFLVGVSLDGPQMLHDIYRQDRGGQPTFRRVMAGLRRLQAHKVELNVLCTVNAANADQPRDVYRFLRDDVGALFIQFIPIVERVGAQLSERSVTGEQYGRFLNGVFDEWWRGDVGRVYIQLFDATLGVWMGFPSSLCIHAATCGTALAMEHNGDLYSCDHFVDARRRLGNILETPLVDLVASKQQWAFGQAKDNALAASCRDCEVRFLCHGGCPKDWMRQAGSQESVNALCAGYKAFFTQTAIPMQRMAAALREGRPAAAAAMVERAMAGRAMAPGAAPVAGRRARPNDPCPCGSGRKYKKCCGRGI